MYTKVHHFTHSMSEYNYQYVSFQIIDFYPRFFSFLIVCVQHILWAKYMNDLHAAGALIYS